MLHVTINPSFKSLFRMVPQHDVSVIVFYQLFMTDWLDKKGGSIKAQETKEKLVTFSKSGRLGHKNSTLL